MAITPWITIPAKDMRVMLPTSTHNDYKLMFANVKAIDEAIKLLEDLKVIIEATEKAVENHGE